MRRTILKPAFWTVLNLAFVAGVWAQVFWWWVIAIMVTLDCIVFACTEWQRWFDSEWDRQSARRVR